MNFDLRMIEVFGTAAALVSVRFLGLFLALPMLSFRSFPISLRIAPPKVSSIPRTISNVVGESAMSESFSAALLNDKSQQADMQHSASSQFQHRSRGTQPTGTHCNQVTCL